MQPDVLIVGGGVGGLQAALTIARFNYRVTVIDAGEPRHRFASHMHNLLGADGETPAQFYGRARTQLAAYPHVSLVQARVTTAARDGAEFVVTTDNGTQYRAGLLLAAFGVRDVLPPIPGLAPLWGSKVVNCPYCHGYELRGKRLGWLPVAGASLKFLDNLLPLSRQIQVFSQHLPLTFDEKYMLQQLGIAVEPQPVAQVQEEGAGLLLTLADGTTRPCDALFIQPGMEAGHPQLAAMLGCPAGAGGFPAADETGSTPVPGLFIAGDILGVAPYLASAITAGQIVATSMLGDLNTAARQRAVQA